MKALHLAAALALLPLQAAAQAELKPVPPKGSPVLGDVFKLRFEAPAGAAYSLRPDTSPLAASDFGFVSLEESGGAPKTYTLKAQAFGIGVSTFPALSWSGAQAGQEARSPEVPVQILPAFDPKKAKEQDIKDIYPPFRYIPWLWVLAALLAAAAAAWAYLRYRARMDALAISNWKDKRTPYQRAEERLNKLAASPLAASGRMKEYYTGLTSILRLYLFEEFRIDASQMTTSDLARALKFTGADLKTILAARDFLNRADLVKFARWSPGNAASDASALGAALQGLAAAADAARAAQAEAEAAAKAQAAAAKGAKP